MVKKRNGSFASIQSQVFILPDSSLVFLLHFVTLFLGCRKELEKRPEAERIAPHSDKRMQGNNLGRKEGSDCLISTRHLGAHLGSCALWLSRPHPGPRLTLAPAASQPHLCAVAAGIGHHFMRAPSKLLLALTSLSH